MSSGSYFRDCDYYGNEVPSQSLSEMAPIN